MMFESKINALLEELETQYVRIKSKTTSTYEVLRYTLGPSSSTVTAMCEMIDVDSFDKLLEWSTEIEFPELTTACKGILIEFPAGKNHHISYPFGLHNEQIIPWDYHSVNNDFYIQAKSCQKPQKKVGIACDDCQALTSTTHYEGIIN